MTRPVSSSGGPDRDEPVLPIRFASYAALILTCAVVGGVVGSCHRYYDAVAGRSYSKRERAERLIREDTAGGRRTRFLIGAVIGGVAGGAFLITWHVKNSRAGG